MRCVGVVFACLVVSCTALPAQATVAVSIDLTHQRMHVAGDHAAYDWPISSAKSGFSTPGGSYAPIRLELMHYSHKYHMSPMPHAIFFRGGYAIHGTYATGSLGRPASHGCVRLSPSNAATLYGMVQAEGARISISGTPPQSSTRFVAAHRERARYAARERPIEAGEPVEPGYGYARGRARAMRRADIDNAYAMYGYRLVGHVQGHRVYQAMPAGTFESPVLNAAGFDPN